MYVRLQLKNGYIDLHQTWHDYFLTQGVEHRKVENPKSVLSLSLGQGVSCSSETKHDRITAQKPK
jgi:hypothetical protein